MMTDINNWKEVTKGIYRYVIAAGAAYEIHINYWDHLTDIKTSNATLFLVGDWRNTSGENFFERETLLYSQPLFECLSAAEKDYKENIS